MSTAITKSNVSQTLAKLVSAILSPPVVVLGAAYIATSNREDRWTVLVAYLAATILWPVGALGAMVWSGLVSDFDVRDRKQRWLPNCAALTGIVPVALWLQRWDAQDPFVVLVLVHALLLGILAVTSLFWKVSYHTTANAVFSGTLMMAFGMLALPCLLGLALVGWSRVRLECHTLGQVVCGAILGLAVYPAILVLLVA